MELKFSTRDKALKNKPAYKAKGCYWRLMEDASGMLYWIQCKYINGMKILY